MIISKERYELTCRCRQNRTEISYGDRTRQGEEMLEKVFANDLAKVNTFFDNSEEKNLITFKSTVER